MTNTLEQITLQHKPKRKGLLTRLLPLLAVGALAGCDGGGQATGCKKDFDCDEGKICVADKCISPGEYCTSDNDCPGESLCTNNVCSGYGSAQLPQERYDEFVSALASDDLDQSLEYFDPLMQYKYKTILGGQDLKQLSAQLKGATLIPATEGEKLREYILIKSCSTDTECPGEQVCENSQCGGIEYSIQFMKTYQLGVETWSIRGL